MPDIAVMLIILISIYFFYKKTIYSSELKKNKLDLMDTSKELMDLLEVLEEKNEIIECMSYKFEKKEKIIEDKNYELEKKTKKIKNLNHDVERLETLLNQTNENLKENTFKLESFKNSKEAIDSSGKSLDRKDINLLREDLLKLVNDSNPKENSSKLEDENHLELAKNNVSFKKKELEKSIEINNKFIEKHIELENKDLEITLEESKELIERINKKIIILDNRRIFDDLKDFGYEIDKYLAADSDLGYLVDIVKEGDSLYHLSNATRCTVKEKNKKNMKLILSEKIGGKKSLDLPYRHIGEWLFFKEEDIDKTKKDLSGCIDYLIYRNRLLLEEKDKKNRIEINTDFREVGPSDFDYDFDYDIFEKNPMISHKRDYSIEQDGSRYNKIEELLLMLKNKYNFKGPHHYTDIYNLEGIFKDGKLFSREKVSSKRKFFDAANKEIILNTSRSVKNQVRFYYKGKTPTLWANEGIKPMEYRGAHMPIPVLLLFKNDLMYREDIRFTYGGAGSHKSFVGLDIFETDEIDWEKVFSDDVENKNIRNLEIWCRDEVDLEYLNKIVFRSEAEKKLGEHLYSDLAKYEYLVDASEFTNSKSYLMDYKCSFSKSTFDIKLKFKIKNLKPDDVHKIEIEYGINSISNISFTLDYKCESLLLEEEFPYNFDHKIFKYKIYRYIYINVLDFPEEVKSFKYYLNNSLVGIFKEEDDFVKRI